MRQLFRRSTSQTKAGGRRAAASLTVLAVLAAGMFAVTSLGSDDVACPPGTVAVTGNEPRLAAPDQQDQIPPQYRGPGEIELPGDCRPDRLESFAEIAARNSEQDAKISGPFGTVAEGAKLAAAEQRQALFAQQPAVNGSMGVSSLHGLGPLNFDEDPYDSGQGIIDSTGRIDDYFYDETNNRLFAAIGTSGVWMSEDLGENWVSIGESLPTQVVSAVSWSPEGGPDGTVVVLTGEHTFGGGSFTGLGAFWSEDLGATWTRAEGPPDGTLGFAIEVDPTDGNTVYAATGRGLFQSTDAGHTYTNVTLPVGPCEDDYNIETCNYAHFVTDVVVKAPGGVGDDTEGGQVVAAVGYRAGMLEDVSGEFIHSEGNGVYRSDTGAPGTFARLDGLDSVAGGRERLGRMEFGPAVGEEQDHDYLYAVLEDAVLFNGGAQYVPIPDDVGGEEVPLLSGNPTVFNGVYVSADFGETWTQLSNDDEMSTICTVNRSVYCIPGVIEPGAQSWYNMWIEPDPTRQVGGVPTRLVMGLEEVFQNRETNVPANTEAVSFDVIGAYYGGVDCLLVATDCAVTGPVGIETTHPDQHDGIFIPTRGEDGELDGGVKLFVGHDGGVSSQTSTGLGSEFTQETWNLEQENGLSTLLPYSVAVANDGTALAGLQDNGTALVDPTADFRQFEVQGADGTISAIDPEDSDYGYASSQGNSLLGVSSDRFENFTRLTPTPSDGTFLFVPPLIMNPLNSDHVLTAGQLVIENLGGREATSGDWTVAIDLGLSEREPLIETDAPPPGRQSSATELYGDAGYVGFCAPCQILQTPYPFDSGIATNVGFNVLPEPGTDKGWHVAAAAGLPERYISSVKIDAYDETAQTVYAGLGGYTRKWVPPGTGANEATDVGEGHVFVSYDAAETFTDISGNLPDTPVLSIEQRGEQLLVGTDLGPFISADLQGSNWAPLGDFGAIPVTDIQMQANDVNVAYLAVYGRGVMKYQFPTELIDGEVRRLGGEGREQTSVGVSVDTYDTAETVVLARSDVYADALAGATLAFKESAPLLLTPSSMIHPDVEAEIQRLGPTNAVLLGGDAALNTSLEQDLRDLGITEIERFGGVDRFETASLIATELDGDTSAWIVKGNDVDPTRGWPDAMSIAPIAARAGQPILLTETDFIPPQTTQALTDLGITDARIVGGSSAVSQTVEDELDGQVTLGDRVAGPNRYATSVEAAKVGLENGHTVENLWLARAGDFADALAAGPSVAATAGSLVLVDTESLDASLESGEFIRENGCDVSLARIVGGTAAISEGVFDEMVELVTGCPLPTVEDPPRQALVLGEGPPEEPEPTEVIAGPFDFEDGPQGWSTPIVIGQANPSSIWRRDSPGADESDISYQVSPYTDMSDARLVSPDIEVDGSQVAVSWSQAVQMEGGDFDNMFVEWSSDGTEWTEVGKFSSSEGFPEFSPANVQFTPPAGTIKVRFRVVSDDVCSTGTEAVCDAESLMGAFVDDVTVLS